MSSSELAVRLDTVSPAWLPVGRGTTIFCNGACFHPHQKVKRGRLRIGSQTVEPSIWRAPRADLVHALGDPRAYRSGFWATVPISPQPQPDRLALELDVELGDGERETHELAAIEIVSALQPPAESSGASLAICLATHEPDVELLGVQVESLRAQTDTDWICLMRDDASSPDRFSAVEQIVDGDPRFRLTRSEQRLGPHRNFERLLAQLPRGPSLIALCDQDDRWHPEKLSVLRDRLGTAQLVYSDQRVVDRTGRVLSPTMWRSRRNQWQDLTSLLTANTVTGAASLMQREVAELALPFPEVPGLALHDHWLALVARATGEIRYVDRPLSDYIQHAEAVLGGRRGAGAGGASRPDARAAYFYGFRCRAALAQTLLVRCGDRLDPRQRRALDRFIAAETSPTAFIRLLLDGIRRRRETLGMEFELARGIIWRELIPLRASWRAKPGAQAFDASCPEPTGQTLGSPRLARWHATL